MRFAVHEEPDGPFGLQLHLDTIEQRTAGPGENDVADDRFEHLPHLSAALYVHIVHRDEHLGALRLEVPPDIEVVAIHRPYGKPACQIVVHL